MVHLVLDDGELALLDVDRALVMANSGNQVYRLGPVVARLVARTVGMSEYRG